MVIFKNWEAQSDFSPKQSRSVPVSAEIWSPTCRGSRKEKSIVAYSDGWLVGSPKVQEEPDGSNFAQSKSEKLPELETWRLEMNGLSV